MLSSTYRSLFRLACKSQSFNKFNRNHTVRCMVSSKLTDSKICHGQTRHFHSTNRLLNKDYYKLLGVNKQSTSSDIKKAYYELAKKHHPDVSKGKDSEKKFQDISEAYEVLGDDSKRKEYDLYGGRDVRNPFGGQSQRTGGFSYTYEQKVNPEDLFRQAFGDAFDFESVFGDQQKARAQPRNRYQMTITFLEAALGVIRNIKLQFPVLCQRCDGRGGEPGTGTRQCNKCRGTGQIVNRVGWYHMQQECPACSGNGTVNAQRCSKCIGKRTVNMTEEAQIEIPAGVENGTSLKYQTSVGVEVGITIEVSKSSVFQRNDLDVMSSVDIDMVKAVIGGSVEIQALTGKVEVTIPRNSQPGTTMRLVGKGISGNLSGRGMGNHLLKLNVTIPRNITNKQRLLLEAFDGNTDNVEELIRLLGGTSTKDTSSGSQSGPQSGPQSRSSKNTSPPNNNTKEPRFQHPQADPSHSIKNSHTFGSRSVPTEEDKQTNYNIKDSWDEFKKNTRTLKGLQALLKSSPNILSIVTFGPPVYLSYFVVKTLQKYIKNSKREDDVGHELSQFIKSIIADELEDISRALRNLMKFLNNNVSLFSRSVWTELRMKKRVRFLISIVCLSYMIGALLGPIIAFLILQSFLIS